MTNPYLVRLREKYDGLRTGIEGLQTRAAEDDRDLTEDELRSVSEQAESAKRLAKQIEDLTEIETRSQKVAGLAAAISGEHGPGQKFRSVGASSTVATDRDPGHYRSVQDGGQHSFFGDLYRSARLHDVAAGQRLAEHARALEPTAEGAGVLPPKWMAEEFAELARQGRRVADAVRRLPITDSRPIPLGKQTAGTDSVVTEQASEAATTSFTDAYDTDVDTLTPKTTSGGQEFRRELLDGSSPAIDQLVYGDLLAAYNAKVEAKVITAIFAAGPTVIDYDDEAANTTAALHVFNKALDAAIVVRTNRKLPPTGYVMGIGAYGKLLGSKDSAGRPVMPSSQMGQAVNVFGVGAVNAGGFLHNLPVVESDGAAPANANDIAAVRLSDVILAESPTLRFYDELSKGPDVIRLAVWGYTGVLVRYATTAVQRIQPDANTTSP